jgi:hypothetical protein
MRRKGTLVDLSRTMPPVSVATRLVLYTDRGCNSMELLITATPLGHVWREQCVICGGTRPVLSLMRETGFGGHVREMGDYPQS